MFPKIRAFLGRTADSTAGGTADPAGNPAMTGRTGPARHTDPMADAAFQRAAWAESAGRNVRPAAPPRKLRKKRPGFAPPAASASAPPANQAHARDGRMKSPVRRFAAQCLNLMRPKPALPERRPSAASVGGRPIRMMSPAADRQEWPRNPVQHAFQMEMAARNAAFRAQLFGELVSASDSTSETPDAFTPARAQSPAPRQESSQAGRQSTATDSTFGLWLMAENQLGEPQETAPALSTAAQNRSASGMRRPPPIQTSNLSILEELYRRLDEAIGPELSPLTIESVNGESYLCFSETPPRRSPSLSLYPESTSSHEHDPFELDVGWVDTWPLPPGHNPGPTGGAE